jgi:hypothetical protein
MAGYAITDQKKYLDFELKKYELESLQDDRITVAVEVCGVCGSVSRFQYQHGLPFLSRRERQRTPPGRG